MEYFSKFKKFLKEINRIRRPTWSSYLDLSAYYIKIDGVSSQPYIEIFAKGLLFNIFIYLFG
jgi:hypothetical protein